MSSYKHNKGENNMSDKSVFVVPAEKGKFKVLVCYIQRGINFNDASKANSEATKVAEEEHITDVHLYEEAKKA